MKPDSLAELYNQKKKQIIQDCDLCGVCLEVCPAIPITSLASIPAPDVLAKVIAVLKDGIISEEASVRAASCMHCVKCQDSCPQGINPVIMQELLLYELTKLGKKRYPLMELKLGDSKLFVPDIMASMQVKQQEKDWLTHVPDKPQQKDVVVFTGCAMLMMPDKIFLIRDILRKLGLNFVIIAGGEYCCGARYVGVNVDEVDAHIKALVNALRAFNPQQVIFCCAECAGRVAYYDREISAVQFEYDELFHFLSQHISELEFTNPVNKKVTLHDPCSISRVLGDTTSLRALLKAIPGLKLTEMSKNREQTICCGAAAGRKQAKVGKAMLRQVLEEAARTGADVMVDACQGCHFQFCPEETEYPFQIENLLTVIGEAMGISYEDKLKKFYSYGNVDKIMAETRECLESSPYDPGVVALLAKYVFTKPAS